MAALLVALAAGLCVPLAGAGVSWAAAAGQAAPGGSAAAAVGIHWGRAEPVPGLGALNKGYEASVSALSCWAAGDCAAGGSYADVHGHVQAFVALEHKGRWGAAIEVPGTAALNKGGNAQVSNMSCARTGACAAVGTYTGKAGNQQWFTAGERSGRWAKAAPVPDAALNEAAISTVWCAPGGLCAAGGSFDNLSNSDGAWVMTETHGRWHPAVEVPGLSALAVPGGTDAVTALSCTSAGNCAAGGSYVFTTTAPVSTPPYYASSTGYSVFVVTETGGRWGTAEQVPGIMAINLGWNANLSLLSCPSAGNCAAAGGYLPQPVGPDPPVYCDPADPTCPQVFTVSEQHGTWKSALGTGLNFLNSLTCVQAGDCVLGGEFNTNSSYPSVVTETNGTWGKMLELSGVGGNNCDCWTATVDSVSCSSAGYCAAGGLSGLSSAFVATEQRGIWGKGVTPGGVPAEYGGFSLGPAQVSAVACPPGIDLCVAGGYYEGPKGGRRAFLVSQSR